MQYHYLLALTLAVAPLFALAQKATLPDPATMDRNGLETELRSARPLIQNGGVLPLRPTGCTSAESRLFDFWLGQWDVSPTGQTFVIAQSSITRHAQGCAILENWRPFQGAQGLSINSFDRRDGLWHQEWVDASGQRHPTQLPALNNG